LAFSLSSSIQQWFQALHVYLGHNAAGTLD
jgi:hypothetical protein